MSLIATQFTDLVIENPDILDFDDKQKNYGYTYAASKNPEAVADIVNTIKGLEVTPEFAFVNNDWSASNGGRFTTDIGAVEGTSKLVSIERVTIQAHGEFMPAENEENHISEIYCKEIK